MAAAMIDTFIAERITRELGGDWHGHYGTAPAPGHSKHDRSLSIRPHHDDPDNVIVHSFAGENWQDIKADWRSRGLLSGTGRRRDRTDSEEQRLQRQVEAARRETASKAERRRIALWHWERSQIADDTIVVAYLRSRGITVDPLPATIRFSPALPPKFPHRAMIAAFGVPEEPEPGILHMPIGSGMGVHFTLLDRCGNGKAGTKRDKFMVGCSAGAPIILAPPGDSLAITIGEGLESVFSVHQETGFGAWAAGSAGRLPALADKVPAWIESVTIAAEDDPAGQQGANQLADQLSSRGIEVRILETANA